MKSNSNSKEIHAERTEAVIQKTNMKTKISKEIGSFVSPFQIKTFSKYKYIKDILSKMKNWSPSIEKTVNANA